MEAHDEANVYFKTKRDQYIVEIRKRKNDEFLMAKRTKLTSEDSRPQPTTTNPERPAISEKDFDIQVEFNSLARDFTKAGESGDFEKIVEATEAIRRAISKEENPPLQELINTGVVVFIARLLDPDYYQYERLIIESSWIMANISAGSPAFIDYLVGLDMVSRAIALFDHPCLEVKENAIWTLANIAGESLGHRDSLLEKGIVQKVVSLLRTCDPEVSFVSQVAWLVSNLSRGKPYPPFEQIEPLVKYLQYFLVNFDNKNIKSYTLWAFSNISDGDYDQIQKVLDLGLTEKMVMALSANSLEIKIPALRTIGNLLTGEDSQTTILVEHGVIDALFVLLDHQRKLVRKEAAWALSNLMAGNYNQIQKVFDYKKGAVLKKLFRMIENDDFEVSKECTYCLTNACYSGTIQQINDLVEMGMIELLIETLRENGEVRFLKACLEALENILQEYKDQEHYGTFESSQIMEKLARCGGHKVIEDLQTHVDNGVYNIVSRLIDQYFDVEESQLKFM